MAGDPASDLGTPEDAMKQAAVIVEFISDRFPGEHPMQINAAMAMALGSMVGAAAALGAIRPGRAGASLEHLFKMAEGCALHTLGEDVG